MEKSKEFGKYVEELTITWLEWLGNINVANDVTMSYSVRRRAGEECELLIKRRHELIKLMNLHFEE
jgi:hypothetical protein